MGFLALVEYDFEQNKKRWDGPFACSITGAGPWMAEHVSKTIDQFRTLRTELLKLDSQVLLEELPASFGLFNTPDESKNEAQRDASEKLLRVVGQSTVLASSVPVKRFLFAPPKPPRPALSLCRTTSTSNPLGCFEALRVGWSPQPDWPADAKIKVETSYLWLGVRVWAKPPVICSAACGAIDAHHKLEEESQYTVTIQLGRDFSCDDVLGEWGPMSDPDSIEVPKVGNAAAFRDDLHDRIYLFKPEPPRLDIEVGSTGASCALRVSWDVQSPIGVRLKIQLTTRGRRGSILPSTTSKVVEAGEAAGGSLLFSDDLLENYECSVTLRLGRIDIEA